MTARLLCGLAAFGFGASAWAHEGHGLPGASHWHAGDTLWWLAGVAAVAAALLARGGKP